MPRQGPEYSKEDADKVAAEVLDFLRTKHRLLTAKSNWNVIIKQRPEVEERLKTVIHEIFWQDACERF